MMTFIKRTHFFNKPMPRFYKVNALVFFTLATGGLVAANCLIHYTNQVDLTPKPIHPTT